MMLATRLMGSSSPSVRYRSSSSSKDNNRSSSVGGKAGGGQLDSGRGGAVGPPAVGLRRVPPTLAGVSGRVWVPPLVAYGWNWAVVAMAP